MAHVFGQTPIQILADTEFNYKANAMILSKHMKDFFELYSGAKIK